MQNKINFKNITKTDIYGLLMGYFGVGLLTYILITDNSNIINYILVIGSILFILILIYAIIRK